MSEESWKLMQMGMWAIGIQTTLIIAVIGAMWNGFNKKFDKIDQRFDKIDQKFIEIDQKFDNKIDKFDIKLSNKIDKLDEKVTDIDRRVCRIEGSMNNKDCCILKSDQQMRKAE